MEINSESKLLARKCFPCLAILNLSSVEVFSVGISKQAIAC